MSTHDSLDLFFPTLDLDSLMQTRSLTLHFTHPEDQWERTIYRLSTLAYILPDFQNLVSFSLTIHGSSTGICPHVSAKNISEVIDALPQSCVNLEIDTGGFEAREDETQDYLCNFIRRVLPRMRNVRLVVSKLCPTMFGYGQPLLLSTANPGHSGWQPIQMPHIETMVIVSAMFVDDPVNDRTIHANWFPCCGVSAPAWLDDFPQPRIQTAWQVATAALLRVAESGGVPAAARLFVTGYTSDRAVNRGEPGMPFLLRSEMVSKKSWVIPVTSWAVRRVRQMNRAWDDAREEGLDREVAGMGSLLSIKLLCGLGYLVEDRVWRHGSLDGRLPASLFEADDSPFAGEFVEPPQGAALASRTVGPETVDTPSEINEYEVLNPAGVKEIWWS